MWGERDPRGKVFLALALSFALAVVPLSRLALLALPAVALGLSAGLGVARLLRLGRAVLVLWGLSLLVNAFLTPGARIGPEELGWLRPSEEGIRLGLGQGLRLAALASVAAWAAATTGALALAGSVEWSVRGCPALRRRVHRGLLPAVLALRLIPIFGEEARRLRDVDRLRGGPRGRWAAVRRAARLAPLWVATVIDRAEALALALALRGYRPDVERTFAHPFRMRIADWGLVAAGVAGLVYAGPA